MQPKRSNVYISRNSLTTYMPNSAKVSADDKAALSRELFKIAEKVVYSLKENFPTKMNWDELNINDLTFSIFYVLEEEISD